MGEDVPYMTHIDLSTTETGLYYPGKLAAIVPATQMSYYYLKTTALCWGLLINNLIGQAANIYSGRLPLDVHPTSNCSFNRPV